MCKSELRHPRICRRVVPLVILCTLLLSPIVVGVYGDEVAVDSAANSIVLPHDGQITVNFIGVGGPGDRTACTGDFGLWSPDKTLIYPDYLYYAAVPFPIKEHFTQDTELVFYIGVSSGSVCDVATYLSTDPGRAIVAQTEPNVWKISWEDWNDNDFNDLEVEIILEPSVAPFLDLPFDYTGSKFQGESRDTEQHGTINAYFDHQYPTYCQLPNTGGCASTDLKAVNFHGYDGGSAGNSPPYRVVYNGHDGIDFAVPANTAVLAAASGKVTKKRYDSCKGNYVIIEHSGGYTTKYYHLDSFAPGLEEGMEIRRNSVDDTSAMIGTVGDTGGCSGGDHIHFMVENADGLVVDPYGWKPLQDSAWYLKVDPWQEYHAENGGVDATSHYLWIHSLNTSMLIDPENNTSLTSPDGDLSASFPDQVFDQPLRVEYTDGLQAVTIQGLSSARTFSLMGFTRENLPVESLNKHFSLVINMGNYFDPGINGRESATPVSAPQLLHWNREHLTWEAVPSSWNADTNTLEASSSYLGTYTLVVSSKVFLPVVISN